jgi:carboxymethylenebutenolidase
MFETEIHVQTPAGQMTSFVSHPDSEGPFPVAVLFMDGVGYREQLKENAKRFAADGYYVVAPDLFYRSGEKLSFDFTRLGDPAYREHLMNVVAAVTPERAMADTEAVLEAVAEDPAASAGPKVCVGYCMGARIALRAASTKASEFVAAAGIHPSALVSEGLESPHLELAKVRGELYFAFAEIDESATEDNVRHFRDELERLGVRGVVERVPGTRHGFAMADLPVFDRVAAERHFARTLDLWTRNLSQQPSEA